MVSPLIGIGASLASNFIPNMRVWNMINLDSNETIQGQFAAEGLTRELSASWGQFVSLNRQHPILQFVHGNLETISFDARFFKTNAIAQNPQKLLDKIESWCRIDSKLRRPPVIQFWIGDGHLTINCTIVGINIKYARPDFFGGLKDVSFTVSLLQFQPFSLEDAEQTDTRYAKGRDGDYYELLAYAEYGNAMLGDVIRKMHPQYSTIIAGDTIKLPSIEGVRTKTVEQKSMCLKTGFGKKDTMQKRLVMSCFDRRSGSYVSHIIKE